MWEREMERNPALGAPGSNTYTGLIASSTNQAIGAKASKVQGLSEKAADELCRNYKPLVQSLAARYSGKGIEFDELSAAAQLGLARALRKFDPGKGVPFGGYAQHWISGQIQALFKPGRDALGFGRTVSLNAPVDVKGEDETVEFIDLVVDDSVPIIGPDLSDLSEQDQYIVQARSGGATLVEIGKSLGISAERVRQREARALSQIKGLMASATVVDLVSRGNISRFPVERTQQWADFRDREPPKHTYREPKPSREVAHHRAKASHLAAFRGNAPLRNMRGPYGGPVIHAWGRP